MIFTLHFGNPSELRESSMPATASGSNDFAVDNCARQIYSQWQNHDHTKERHKFMATTSSSPNLSPEHIFQTMNAHHQTTALKTAIEMDLFTAIDEGNHRAEALAKRLHASERGVRILSDYLTIIGFLRKKDGEYNLTEEAAAFLSKRSPKYMGTISEFLTNRQHFENMSRLAEAVRHGGAVSETGANREPNDALWVSFARSMASLAVPSSLFIAHLVKTPDPQPLRVLDIAAGHGMYGITIAKQNPKAEITAVDWPAVLEVAKENAAAAGVADRYRTRPGSAFEADLGEGYDLALLTNIFHHFDKETCVVLMRRIHQALKPGGRAVTLEFVPNEDRISPPMEAAFSLLMLVGTNAGEAYTCSEYKEMFKEAGFEQTVLHTIPGMPQQVLVSEKVR
jgi:2-polyprenyl-3-methyl-5-hydroxy-6-metoxy-1,4-benzoquinol methylase